MVKIVLENNQVSYFVDKMQYSFYEMTKFVFYWLVIHGHSKNDIK